MHCAYCGVDYSFEDFCLCLPPARKTEAPAGLPKVEGPWGEAAMEWSLRAVREAASRDQTVGEA